MELELKITDETSDGTFDVQMNIGKQWFDVGNYETTDEVLEIVYSLMTATKALEKADEELLRYAN